MKRRICLWALIGFTVACCWAAFAFFTMPNPYFGRSAIVAITAPASLIGRSMPLSLYWFILLNGAIYALVGLLIEVLRPVNRHRLSN